jgi:hypothetical protein
MKKDREPHMSIQPKTARKPYRPPSFRMVNAKTAKTELEANGDLKDENVHTMLRLIDEELNPRNTRDIRSYGDSHRNTGGSSD